MMKMGNFFKKNNWILIIICLILIGLGVFGYINNPIRFFDIKFSLIITLLVGSIITIIINSLLSSDNKKREFLDDLVCKLYDDVCDIRLYKFNDEISRSDILFKIRHLRNSMKLLKSAGKKYISDKNIEYICNEIDKYENIIDVNIDNIDNLKNKESELRNHLSLIEDKLNAIRFDLYKF